MTNLDNYNFKTDKKICCSLCDKVIKNTQSYWFSNLKNNNNITLHYECMRIIELTYYKIPMEFYINSVFFKKELLLSNILKYSRELCNDIIWYYSPEGHELWIYYLDDIKLKIIYDNISDIYNDVRDTSLEKSVRILQGNIDIRLS